MFQIPLGILCGLAAVLWLGTVQFASGSDLGGSPQDGSAGVTTTMIDRTAKSDRDSVTRASSHVSQTVSIRLYGFPDTSILVRVPANRPREEVRDQVPTSPLARTPEIAKKSTVACEPVVSVLTEVAKQLQPARCIA